MPPADDECFLSARRRARDQMTDPIDREFAPCMLRVAPVMWRQVVTPGTLFHDKRGVIVVRWKSRRRMREFLARTAPGPECRLNLDVGFIGEHDCPNLPNALAKAKAD